MIAYTDILLVGGAAVALLFGLSAARLDPLGARGGGVFVAALAGAACLAASRTGHALALVATALVQALAVLIAAPRTRSHKVLVFDTMLILSGNLLVVGGSAAMSVVGWALALAPVFVTAGDSGELVRRRRVPLGYAAAQVAAFAAFACGTALPGTSSAAALLLVGAGVLRLGLPPFHITQLRYFETIEAPLVTLLAASPAGALAIAAGAARPGAAALGALAPFIGALAMASLLYIALLALAQTSPRALAARLSLFAWTAAAIFAAAGDMVARGAGLLLTVIGGLATVGLGLVAWLVEERFGKHDAAARSGLAASVPTLGALFFFFGLLAAGAPLTVGFVAEDLWLRALFSLSSAAGALVIVAMAVAAIAAYRLYARVFLGPSDDLPASFDATGRERAALALVLAASLLTGLVPSLALRHLRDFPQAAHHSQKETRTW